MHNNKIPPPKQYTDEVDQWLAAVGISVEEEQVLHASNTFSTNKSSTTTASVQPSSSSTTTLSTMKHNKYGVGMNPNQNLKSIPKELSSLSSTTTSIPNSNAISSNNHIINTQHALEKSLKKVTKRKYTEYNTSSSIDNNNSNTSHTNKHHKVSPLSSSSSPSTISIDKYGIKHANNNNTSINPTNSKNKSSDPNGKNKH